MKQLLLAVLLMSLIAGCTRTSGEPNALPQPGAHETGGGVDVGNMNVGLIPQTHASMNFPGTWTSKSDASTISIQNTSGSLISASRADITDIASPNAIGLQQYLKAKFPDRDYEVVNFNGFEGVRAELAKSTQTKHSDLYLVSELKDFIHIESQLNSSANGIVEGDGIIMTVRLKYKGVPVANSVAKTITLVDREASSGGDQYAYSFLGDCFTYSSGCHGNGVAVALEQDEFSIGTSGAAHGRIIDLGSDLKVPFSSVNVDGDSLVAPLSTIPLADIYTVFTPADPKIEQDRISLLSGHTYLIRTVNWPREDILTKIHVDSAISNKELTLTYQKLVMVPTPDLQKQIDEINKYTIEHEQPLSTGEVTLYTRSEWNNYFYASFNFQYSTSGNYDITRNSWDLSLDRNRFQTTALAMEVPHSSDGIGQVIDVGAKDLGTITRADFPDPNNYVRKEADLIIGHTYTVYHYDYNDNDASLILGAFTVLDIDKDAKWARLKFRRILVSRADHFQKWISLAVPTGLVQTSLEVSAEYLKGRYYPLIMKRGDQDPYGYDSFELQGYNGSLTLHTDSRPFEHERGFFNLGSNVDPNSVTLAQVEHLTGQLASDVSPKKGDVIAAVFENFYDKTVVVMRVDDATNISMSLSMRYLMRAKTAYSDAKN